MLSAWGAHVASGSHIGWCRFRTVPGMCPVGSTCLPLIWAELAPQGPPLPCVGNGGGPVPRILRC